MTGEPKTESDKQPSSFEDPRFRFNAQESYKVIRQTTPVLRVETPVESDVVVTKHEDMLTVLRSPEVFSSEGAAVDIGQIRPLPPLQFDPPEHSKYRKLTDPLFSPKRVAALEGATRELVVDLMNAIADDGRANFHRKINKHLAFGGGVHRCTGSHLARMELRVVLKEWHARVPHYQIADGVEIEHSQSLRQVENLEIVW